MALMNRKDAATMAQCSTFRQQSRNALSFTYEAFPYRHPRPIPHCRRHRYFIAAPWLAAAVVRHLAAEAAGVQRQCEHGAAGG